MRTQDAVPDELEIVPEGKEGKHHPRLSDQDKAATPGGVPIPKTVVQKVDPTSPSHGEVPGTAAHSIRQADAVPDVITRASDSTHESTLTANTHDHSNDTPIPKTQITRVDSEPSHDQVPETKADLLGKGDTTPDVVVQQFVEGKFKPSYKIPFRERLTESGLPTSSLSRSTLSVTTTRPPSTTGNSPIAADGGFGPMNDEDPEDESAGSNVTTNSENEIEEGFGDDFDDFEAGAVDEDFGDFNEEFEKRGVEPPKSDQVPVSPFVSRFAIRLDVHLLPQFLVFLFCTLS